MSGKRLLLVSCFPAVVWAASPGVFTNWPTGSDPTVIGKRVAERFVGSPRLRSDTIIYPEVCAWYGALEFAKASGDRDLGARLIRRFDPLLTPAEAALVPTERHVDFSVFGAVPLEIYIQTRERKYLDLGLSIADRQWATPTSDGLTSETRYWIDDMFMITAVQVQAYRATGDTKYLDRAALEMVTYLDKLQQPNGLFYHAPDVPFLWGRGNGWVAAGMTELLRSLPANHPRRERILSSYRKMMGALVPLQGSDGVWRQLLDHKEAWAETSSTGMFTFAMITGVKEGWIDEKSYGAAARRAWLGLIKYLEPNGDVRNVCEGTGKKNDLQYYLDRQRLTGDLHGQAPILWSAAALLRSAEEQKASVEGVALDGIAHAAFRVTDIPASREFYGRLGFEQAFDFSDERGTTTSYVKINDRQFIELYRRNSTAEPLGLMHLCFDGSAIEHVRDAYLQRGLQPAAAAKARAGNLLFSMHDPEGQVLEYTQYLPGSLHWNVRGQYAGDRRISEHLVSAAVGVKDVSAERAFYIDKLGFHERGSGSLSIPGDSGEGVRLEAAKPDWKARIEFAVPNVKRAAEELRSRGFAVKMSGNSAVIVDPDGVVVAFH